MYQARPLSCLFSFFLNTNFTEKTVDFSGIQTRIVGLEGKHVDQMTTTAGQTNSVLNSLLNLRQNLNN